MDFSKIAEVDIIWGFIYAGMFMSVLVVILVIYGILKGE